MLAIRSKINACMEGWSISSRKLFLSCTLNALLLFICDWYIRLVLIPKPAACWLLAPLANLCMAPSIKRYLQSFSSSNSRASVVKNVTKGEQKQYLYLSKLQRWVSRIINQLYLNLYHQKSAATKTKSCKAPNSISKRYSTLNHPLKSNPVPPFSFIRHGLYQKVYLYNKVHAQIITHTPPTPPPTPKTAFRRLIMNLSFFRLFQRSQLLFPGWILPMPPPSHSFLKAIRIPRH